MLVESPVRCDLDLDAPGKRFGRPRPPRAGCSTLGPPIVSIRGSEGRAVGRPTDRSEFD
jgi:hypothetical protein